VTCTRNWRSGHYSFQEAGFATPEKQDDVPVFGDQKARWGPETEGISPAGGMGKDLVSGLT
jgi:hypothetical protein